MTHTWVSKLTIIGFDNGLSPCRRQVIIWANAGIQLIWPLATNFSEISIEIYISSLNEFILMLSIFLGLNVLKTNPQNGVHFDQPPKISQTL